MLDLFDRAFTNVRNVRPATDWRGSLDKAMSQLIRCRTTKAFLPAAAGNCPWCSMIRDLPADVLPAQAGATTNTSGRRPSGSPEQACQASTDLRLVHAAQAESAGQRLGKLLVSKPSFPSRQIEPHPVPPSPIPKPALGGPSVTPAASSSFSQGRPLPRSSLRLLLETTPAPT